MKNNELISISKLSRISGISARMLRYYDEKGILEPADYSESGQRLYDESAFFRLQVISSFSYLGYSVDQIRDVLQNVNQKDLVTVFKNQRKMLEDEREKLNEVIDVLSGVIEKTERNE